MNVITWSDYDGGHVWRDAGWWWTNRADGCVGIIPNGGATSTTRTCGVRLGGGGEQANGADWSMVERRNNVQA